MFLHPEASDSDWSVLLRHCRRRQFDVGEAVITAGAASRSLACLVQWTALSKCGLKAPDD